MIFKMDLRSILPSRFRGASSMGLNDDAPASAILSYETSPRTRYFLY